jgi:uncharacterized membrane protein
MTKLEIARDLYVSARTQRERDIVDQHRHQVERTNNIGGRAQHRLDEAKVKLDLAVTAAQEVFRAAVEHGE